MVTSTLTSKGKTTIPENIRERINLYPGDRLEFVIDEGGRMRMLPASIDASERMGILSMSALARKEGASHPLKVNDEMNIDIAPSLWSRKGTAMKFH